MNRPDKAFRYLHSALVLTQPERSEILAYVKALEDANARLVKLGQIVERERDDLAARVFELEGRELDKADPDQPSLPLGEVAGHVGNLNQTCDVCGSEPGELCRRDSLACEFRPRAVEARGFDHTCVHCGSESGQPCARGDENPCTYQARGNVE